MDQLIWLVLSGECVEVANADGLHDMLAIIS